MTPGRGRVLAGVLAGVILLLFAGRWATMVLADGWWAAAVAPAAAPFVMRYHLLGALVEGVGLLVAVVWCVGHLLVVVGSIEAVQVPRRLGDLEIRELLPAGWIRSAAVLVGALGGLLLGAGGARALPIVWQAWHGLTFGVEEPVLGHDVGLYLAQLPFWELLLGFLKRLVWGAFLGAGLCHFAVGGLRVSRRGVELTEVARRQLGFLLAGALLLAGVGEALGPFRSVAGLDPSTLAVLSPGARWSVALAWGAAAITAASWAARPAPSLVVTTLVLWAGPGLLAYLVAPVLAAPIIDDGVRRPIAALAVGNGRVVPEITIPATARATRPPAVGLWDLGAANDLLRAPESRLLALSRTTVAHGEGQVPVWLALRADAEGGKLIAIADDRLAPGGAPVSYREGDPADYPGIVTWRDLGSGELYPGRADTVGTGLAGGIPLGGPARRMALAWGTQVPRAISEDAAGATLGWRLSPRERIASLAPFVWWTGARARLIEGRLHWVAEGWSLAEGAALAPAIPWEGRSIRYARASYVAVVDASTGATRFYLRPDADPLAQLWSEVASGMFLPPDSLPPALRNSAHGSLEVAVVAWALSHPGAVATWAADSTIEVGTAFWRGGRPETQVALGGGDRLTGLVAGSPDGVVHYRWSGTAPLTPDRLQLQWSRFASYERLADSVRAAGGRVMPGMVRYEVGPTEDLAVAMVYAASPGGVPRLVWVDLASGETLGAARTPATAWANLRGESVPLVPAPDLPDPLTEARRWTVRADSALRAGDLTAFARAFDALKRVLGTP